jgi:hypothetical protein
VLVVALLLALPTTKALKAIEYSSLRDFGPY